MPAAPDAAIAVMLVIFITRFKVIRIIQGLADQIPLKRGAIAAINRKGFVGAPTHTAMVNDNFISACAAKGIIATVAINHAAFLGLITHSKTHVANDDVIAAQLHRLVG